MWRIERKFLLDWRGKAPVDEVVAASDDGLRPRLRQQRTICLAELPYQGVIPFQR
jgi:hypothetical protein